MSVTYYRIQQYPVNTICNININLFLNSQHKSFTNVKAWVGLDKRSSIKMDSQKIDL